MDPINEFHTQQSRRAFLEHGTLGLGGMALGALVLCPWAAAASLRQALE